MLSTLASIVFLISFPRFLIIRILIGVSSLLISTLVSLLLILLLSTIPKTASPFVFEIVLSLLLILIILRIFRIELLLTLLISIVRFLIVLLPLVVLILLPLVLTPEEVRVGITSTLLISLASSEARLTLLLALGCTGVMRSFSKHVVHVSLLLVLENLVGAGYLLELLLESLVVSSCLVRVILLSQLVVGLLYVLLGGPWWHT